MLRLLLSWLIIALALVLIAQILPGIEVATWGTAFIAGLVIGLINLLIRPILQLLALPITMLTLGLFAFIVNAFLFWLASVIVPGFEVYGFLSALLGSLILALVYSLFNQLVPA